MSSSSYRSVLKTTSLIGGSSLINLLISMVKNKFVAILLGPSGFGLMSVFGTITVLVGTISGMGVAISGVRQIAEAQGIGDQEQVARVVKTLRRTVWATGLLGLIFMVAGCGLLSRAYFGTYDHALAIALLGITIMLGNIAAGQSCILQGTRRISALAKVSVISAINGTVLSIPCFYLWGQKGIVPSLLLCATAALGTSWYYSRQIALKPVSVTWRESRGAAVKLLHFGAPLMAAGLIGALSTGFINALLVRQVGLAGVGIWQAACSLSGVMVNFVIGAMTADYYPRLTAVAHDDQHICDEVNAQTEIALLLAVPGLALTIAFAPLAIALFYSGKFDAAVIILRWSVYGILGRVITWPMGFVLLAKGMGKTFFCTETLSNGFYVAAIWFCTRQWGLPGTGIAFLLMYLFSGVIIYFTVNAISRTTWTRANVIHMVSFASLLILIGLVSAWVSNPWMRYSINLVFCAGLILYCLQRLSLRSGITLYSLKAKVWGA